MRYMLSSIVFVLSLLTVGCELFVIGNAAKPRLIVERSQRTAAGVVHLFKAELDSNNTVAATELMVSATGRPLLAVEKYELADDLNRWKAVMNTLPITDTQVDTIDADNHSVTVTLDYFRKMNFNTTRRESTWWITKVVDPQRK